MKSINGSNSDPETDACSLAWVVFLLADALDIGL